MNDRLLNAEESAQAIGCAMSASKRWIVEHRIAAAESSRPARIAESKYTRLISNGLTPALDNGGRQ